MSLVSKETDAFLVLKSSQKEEGRSKYLNQVLLSMAASLGYLTVGLVRGFSSSAIPSIEESDVHLLSSPSAESWISAVPPLGAAVGSLCAGPLLQRIGRKRTLMISAPLFAFGWALIASAGSTQLLITARMLTGFCAGIAIPSAQIYVSECSDPEVRGIIGSLPSLFMAGGILVSYTLGAWLPWQQLAWASALFPALLLVVLVPLPESPTWLANRGRRDEAERANKWLNLGYGRSDPVLKHRQSIVSAIVFDESSQIPNGVDNKDESQKERRTESSPFSRKELLRRPVIIPLLLSLALLIFQQLSGIDAIVFYTVAIFRSAGSPLNDHLATILVGIVQLVANSLSLFVIDRTGRRFLLISSGLLMSVSMAALGTYFHLHERNQASNLGLLPLISLIVFMIGFSIGYCSIPFLLMGELLPLKQRSWFSSIAGSFNLAFMFIVIKTYPDLKSALGSQGAFWLYSAVCLSSCVFVWFFVPETKGKSLEEIEEYFENRHAKKAYKEVATQDIKTQDK